MGHIVNNLLFCIEGGGGGGFNNHNGAILLLSNPLTNINLHVTCEFPVKIQSLIILSFLGESWGTFCCIQGCQSVSE